MRKKFITFLLAFSLTSSMLLTACGNKETDSGGGKTETETEAPAADDQQAESEESDEVTTEEEDAVKESETPDVVLTADTEITEEDIQKVYASIKESVTTEYLEPNGIDPATFSLPASEEAWSYFFKLSESYYMELFTGVEIDTSSTENLPPSPEKEIMDSIFKGLLRGLDNLGKYDADYYSKFTQKLSPFNTNIINNVTFN